MMRGNATCLTIGDYTGIGPEITAKFLQRWHRETLPAPLVVIGHIANLKQTAKILNLTLPDQQITYLSVPEGPSGHMAYQAIETAVRLIAEGQTKALVTGPISKEHLKLAGIPYPGHTEMLQDLAERYFPQGEAQPSYQSDMLFVYQQFRMLLLTRHVALREVSRSLKVDQVTRSLEAVVRFLQDKAGIAAPKLGILGVNPHAGEMDSTNDNEEQRVLLPAMANIHDKFGLELDHPLAADAAFRNFNAAAPPYDCYIAAYHDQGLIPMKLVAGFQAVNVTLGLPFLRTSVSHGTAPNIAGRGIADPTALHAAFDLALSLTTPSATPPESFPA